MIISIYGGIGSGKSYVAGYLKKTFGAEIIEDDRLAHELYRKGNKGERALTELFPHDDIHDPEGNIDRKKLGVLISGNSSALQSINRAIHPLVYEYQKELVMNSEALHTVIEAALIPEARDSYIDSVWAVLSPPEMRIARLMETRNYTREKAEYMISLQPTDKMYSDAADHVIYNKDSLKELEKKAYETFEYCQWQQR